MSKVIQTYNQLPPKVKQSINNVAARAARNAVQAVSKKAAKVNSSKARSRTTRTRNGMRVYAPNNVIETHSVAPVSYATTWTSGNKSLRIHQTEVIGRVAANSTWFPSWNANYSVAAFPINPANPRTFPWLSYIARLYDKYKFHGLRFIYVNSVSTQQEGNLMMSLDYDTLDEAPANLIQASQLAKYKMTPLYVPCDFSIPTSHPGNNTWLYTFDLSATTNTVDLKTYNLGNFFLSLDGVPQDGKDYGYLAVEYDVELLDKNPVVDVFASMTYDSGARVAKRSRSNVDPADTMVVSVDWKQPGANASINSCTITFSDDVPIGSKARIMLTLAAAAKPTGSSSDYSSIGFDSTVETPDGVEVLSSLSPSSYMSTASVAQITMTLNLDAVVPEDRELILGIPAKSGTLLYVGSSSASYYTSQIMSYTYA